MGHDRSGEALEHHECGHRAAAGTAGEQHVGSGVGHGEGETAEHARGTEKQGERAGCGDRRPGMQLVAEAPTHECTDHHPDGGQ